MSIHHDIIFIVDKVINRFPNQRETMILLLKWVDYNILFFVYKFDIVKFKIIVSFINW